MGLFDAFRGLLSTGVKTAVAPIKMVARPEDAPEVFVDTVESVVTAPIDFLEDLFD